ncbi:Hypothetical predicted protein [Marmota monax]|uniref:Uncharacterized protein n=1 Tax=Marmota monax TaxID=9995 RepID=A0A5E4B9W1_MARMO|nr:hypothetical protein GHT09_012348 [Marmota monax]VTJ66438.1 Hypothetical predicted protein [Marmota monax]
MGPIYGFHKESCPLFGVLGSSRHQSWSVSLPYLGPSPPGERYPDQRQDSLPWEWPPYLSHSRLTAVSSSTEVREKPQFAHPGIEGAVFPVPPQGFPVRAEAVPQAPWPSFQMLSASV